MIARRFRSRRASHRPAVLIVAFLLLWPFAAQAQSFPTPGSSCTTANLWIESSTASLSGIENFMFCNGSTWNSVINFQNNGNVGIGTTSPGNLLQVAVTASSGSRDTIIDIGGAYSGTANGNATIDLTGASNGVNSTAALWADYLGGLNMSPSGNGNYTYFRDSGNNVRMAINSGNVGIGTTSPNALLDLGLNGTTTGNLRLEGFTSGYVQISPPAAAGSWTLTLPNSAGTSGYVLSTDGAGNTSWISNSGTSSTALSGITAAAATHSISNANFAQTWNWNTLTTQTALTITASAMKGGSLISLQSTAAAATNTGYVLSVTDASTGTGYGIYSSMTGHANTGYAGYFINTDTSTNQNYGIYVKSSSTNLSGMTNSSAIHGEAVGAQVMAVEGYNEGSNLYGSLAGESAAVYGAANNHGNTGYGGQFANTDTGADANYGVYSSNASTGAGYGVYGTITGHGNTGYAGYFVNTDTSSSQNYGVWAITNSTNGYSAGVYGECDNANCQGLYGLSTNGAGVYGSSTNATGVSGFSPNSFGVFGGSGGRAAGAAGVFGSSNGTSGAGVMGQNNGSGDTGYGGYFYNVSTGGYAGYFTNTNTGAPDNSAIVSIYSNNNPAGQDLFDVGLSGWPAIAVDQWGNDYFEGLDYLFGYDNNFRVEALSTNNAPLYITTDGTANGSNHNINLMPNGSGEVYVNGTININSGNTNTDIPLIINANTADRTITLNRQDDTNDRAMITLGNALPQSTTVPTWYIGEDYGDYGVSFLPYNGSGENGIIYFSPAGNVGIGTTAPQTNLSVNLGMNIDQADANAGGYSGFDLSFGYNSGEGIGSARTGTTNLNGLDFYTDYYPRVSITNAGKVGINNTNPGAMLDLYDSQGAYFFKVTATSGAWTGIDSQAGISANYILVNNNTLYAGYDGNVSGDVFASTPGNNLILSSDENGSGNDNILLLPHGTGKVGIGLTGPSAALAVAGHIDTHGTAPGSLTSGCGASASIAGNDQAFTITAAGTGRSTTCGATFNQNWASTPVCVSQVTTSMNPSYVSATTTSALTVTTSASLAASAKINVICHGYE